DAVERGAGRGLAHGYVVDEEAADIAAGAVEEAEAGHGRLVRAHRSGVQQQAAGDDPGLVEDIEIEPHLVERLAQAVGEYQRGHALAARVLELVQLDIERLRACRASAAQARHQTGGEQRRRPQMLPSVHRSDPRITAPAPYSPLTHKLQKTAHRMRRDSAL